MKIDRVGGWLIGTVMLIVGLAVLASGIDPLVLCFKQCELPKAFIALLGPSTVRVTLGFFFLALAALFMLPLVSAARRKSGADPDR